MLRLKDQVFSSCIIPQIGNNGTCGNDVGLPSSTEQKLNVMSVRGSKFRNKPTDACTILMWAKLEDNKGVHKLFYTTGKTICKKEQGFIWSQIFIHRSSIPIYIQI